MGREIRRVPLDFNWPLNKVWEGFVNPHNKPCPETGKTCFSGYKAEYHWLEQVCQLMARMGDEAANAPYESEFKARGRIYPDPALSRWESAPEHFTGQGFTLIPLGPGLAQLVEALSGEKCGGVMGSSGTAWGLMKRILKAGGIKTAKQRDQWIYCPVCEGRNMDPAVWAAHDAWKPYDPPTGEGWQLWETVSDGSPISSVYGTRELFVKHLINKGYSPESAERFTEMGWAPSGIITQNGQLLQDIDCALAMNSERDK
jgi:hypothetical protein